MAGMTFFTQIGLRNARGSQLERAIQALMSACRPMSYLTSLGMRVCHHNPSACKGCDTHEPIGIVLLEVAQDMSDTTSHV